MLHCGIITTALGESRRQQHLTSMRNNQLQLRCNNIMFPPLLMYDVHIHFKTFNELAFIQKWQWNLIQETCLSSGRKSPHKYYFTRIGFKIITRPINHIQFPFCYFTVLRRRNNSHETGLVNKWLQIMQSINSRGTWKYQAVRSKWKLLACSRRSFWIPLT